MVKIEFSEGVAATDIIYDMGNIMGMSDRIIEILQTHRIPLTEISNPALKDISEDYNKIIELCKTTSKKAEWVRNTCIEPETYTHEQEEILNKLGNNDVMADPAVGKQTFDTHICQFCGESDCYCCPF